MSWLTFCKDIALLARIYYCRNLIARECLKIDYAKFRIILSTLTYIAYFRTYKLVQHMVTSQDFICDNTSWSNYNHSISFCSLIKYQTNHYREKMLYIWGNDEWQVCKWFDKKNYQGQNKQMLS